MSANKLIFKIRAGRGTALALCGAIVLSPLSSFAQRRRAEPEANPDFQNSMKAKADDGPVSDRGSADPTPATDSGGEERMIESRNVQSVQIGAAPTAKPVPTASSAPLDTRVTVRVKGAPLATFLDTISAQAKVNFIITEGLEQKRVTAFLQNVTVREALQVLLEIKGLTYQQIGHSNTYVVTQRSKQAENLITRIYTLSFVPLIPLVSDDSEKAAAGVGMGSSPSGGGGNAKPCNQKNQNISVVHILCGVLSKLGDIDLEPRTNSLIVSDIAEVFPQVEQIIAELDKKAPQVMIEAQIVEIDSSRTRNLGFEWGGTNGELASFTGGQRDTTFPLNLSRNLSQTHIFDPLAPNGLGILSQLAGSGSSSGGQVIGSYLKTSVLDLTQLRITLRALVQRSEARFLGKPKILTLNNKMARIEITTNEAVAIQSNIQGGQGTSQASTTAERYDTGVVLKVTPQVNKDGYITMLLQPSFSDVQEAAISQASNRIFNRVQRSASTLVRVKNGQTLVLGGLLRSSEDKVVRKVPFLGYIPIIGWFFTSELNSRKNTDLVIFITPTIVSD
jgi:type IV pilus secretin PilQ/predicted competence protein